MISKNYLWFKGWILQGGFTFFMRSGFRFI